MAFESIGDQPERTGYPGSWHLGDYEDPARDLDQMGTEFDAMGQSSGDDGATLVEEDPIEALLSEARKELDRPPESRKRQVEIPQQPVHDRDEENHRHHLMQEAEFHHLFGKLTRSQIVELMLEQEASQRAAALATPDLEYTPSYESDKRRTAAYLERKLGKRDE